MVQDERMSPWGGEQDPGQSLHNEGNMDYTNSEQLVPGQANYQPNKYVSCNPTSIIKHTVDIFTLPSKTGLAS